MTNDELEIGIKVEEIARSIDRKILIKQLIIASASFLLFYYVTKDN